MCLCFRFQPIAFATPSPRRTAGGTTQLLVVFCHQRQTNNPVRRRNRILPRIVPTVASQSPKKCRPCCRSCSSFVFRGVFILVHDNGPSHANLTTTRADLSRWKRRHSWPGNERSAMQSGLVASRWCERPGAPCPGLDIAVEERSYGLVNSLVPQHVFPTVRSSWSTELRTIINIILQLVTASIVFVVMNWKPIRHSWSLTSRNSEYFVFFSIVISIPLRNIEQNIPKIIRRVRSLAWFLMHLPANSWSSSLQGSDFFLFPNPTSGEVFDRLDSIDREMRCSVFNDVTSFTYIYCVRNHQFVSIGLNTSEIIIHYDWLLLFIPNSSR